MKSNTVIYLMRHGLDDESFIGGWSEGSLIDEGRKQVENATNFIVQNITEINSIYHSGLKRTIETVDIIKRKLNLPVFTLDALKELNKGNLNGMKVETAKKLYPEFVPNPLICEKYPNGESLQDLYNRVKLFLEDIDKFDKSLLVTHRGFINMLYFILNSMEINYDKKQFGVVHSSIHMLKFRKIERVY